MSNNKFLQIMRNPSLVHQKIFNLLIKQKKARLDSDIGKERSRLVEFLATHFHADVHAIYKNYLNSEFKLWYDAKKSALADLSSRHTTSNFDCEALYLLVRSVKPDLIVETGVLYGASSSHILEALEQNQTGRLISIDLEQKKPGQGFLIRETSKKRWQLILGDGRVELPGLLNKLHRIDLFFHDSLHTFNHQSWEYELAYSHFSPSGVLASHDVLSSPVQRSAFEVFCRKHHLKYGIFRNLGIALCSSRLGQASRSTLSFVIGICFPELA